MAEAKEQIREILKKAYQIEVDGYTFYSMAAEQASKEPVQELFDKLARDEIQHQAYIKSVMGAYEDKGVQAFELQLRDPDLKSFTATIFTDQFRRQAQGADFELGVLSVGMTLEARAVEYFSGAAASAEDREIRDFYQALADWEQQHLEALRLLHGSVREDFWTAGGFSPY